ncbi:nuclear protein 96-domain-containing protein [Hysterangium stoloniferum]|nr:nuclear protein 96-domain-containing protein [Hysterangium stoloniferum]
MARFGLTEDSDEDEVLVQNGTHIPTETQVTKDQPAGKGKGRAASPPMQVDELVGATRRRRLKPTATALVEGEGGETRYAHEVRPRERKTSTSDEDEDEAAGRHPRRNGNSTTAPAPWPAQIGLEPHRIHVMQTSLFRMPEEQAAFTAGKQKIPSTSKLKPREHAEKLLNASAKLARKHSRGSEGGGDSMRVDKAERASFDDHSVDPEPYRPARKVARVQSGQSICVGQDGAYVDAGLAFGRSFRVSWGPDGQLARICGLSSSVVQIESIALVADDEDSGRERASRLLEAQIEHSTVELDDSAIPVAFPSRSLRFSTFATLFPQHDNSHEAQVWRQGVALFDPLQQPTSQYIPPTVKPRLVAIQRRTALAVWLSETVAPTIAATLRDNPSASSAQRSFIRLTGHQIEEAADAAAADGNPYLAMLISQAGGDTEFRTDLDTQLSIWTTEGSDRLISEAYRKCLAVLSGVTNVWRPLVSSANTQANEVNVVNGLDWKRAFGLALWYGAGSEGASGYEVALEQFEQTMGRDGAPIPLQWYKESQGAPVATASSSRGDLEEADALFELLRLAAAQIPLERAIYPRAFSPNSLDYRMTWHIYMLLSRAMRIKDFSDRHFIADDSELGSGAEGHSETADNITCAYAAQLEALGQLQKAVFVLLHLEDGHGRERAIKELLLRQAHILEPWQIVGLQSLSIPIEWIEAALGCLAQYEGRTFDAYEHFLKADEQRLAHILAVNDLAPDAVIRDDLALLQGLFQPFNPQVVDDWSFRGKLFLDYVDATERIPKLIAATSRQDAVADASDALELSRLKNTVPQLIRALPDVFKDRSDPRQKAALSVMLSGLLLLFDSLKTKSGVQPEFDVDLVDEATRLRHIHNAAYNRFIQSVSVAA